MNSFDRRNEEEAKGSPQKKKKAKNNDSEKKEEQPTMKDLERSIIKLYRIIHSRGAEMDDNMALMQDPLYMLREIESKILLMFEEKDFIEEVASKSNDVSKRLNEAERIVDRDRKQIRYQKKKKIEHEQLLAR